VLISDLAIKKPIVTIVTMLALTIFGVFALLRTEVDEFPDITFPLVFVGIPYPGATPEQVERDVVDRVEEELAALSGVDEIRSTSTDGFGQILVQFVFEKSPDQAAQDVRDALSAARGDLPLEMEEPIIRKFDPQDLPIVSLVLAGEGRSPAELTLLADPGITKELRAVAGVAQVNVIGAVEREVSVFLRPEALRASRVSVAEVVAALQAQNLSAPVGRVEGAAEERSIRLSGRVEDPAAFAELVVAARDGALIRLGQVADVAAGVEEARSAALFDGREAVGLDIIKAEGASTTTVAEGVLAALERVRPTLPPGVDLEVVVNSGERVSRSVANVQEALFEGAMLTVLVVFLFLASWRSTVITGLALPVSVMSAFIAVYAFGFTLNTMSLLGLTLAIGILVDDAIVVRENIVRHIERGEDHRTAAHRGTDEIGLAVAATTFSIVAVFVPVAFIGGIAGQWMRPFALTIACAVLVSLFVSFSLDPMMSAYWPDPQLEQHARRGPIGRALLRFDRWFDRVADRYQRVIGWALDHRWTMVLLAGGTLVGAFVIQARFGGAGFAPASDRSELNVTVEAPAGSTLAYTRAKAEEIARKLRARPEVAYTYVTVGGGGGLFSGAGGEVDTAGIYARLTPKGERELSQDQLSAVLRRELRAVGGVTATVFSGGFGGNQKQIQLELRGTSLPALAEAADRVEAAARSVPGAVDVGRSSRGQKPELEVRLERGLAASLGVSVAQVAQALRPAFAGIDAGDWVDPTGETRDVMVRLRPEARRSAADVGQLPLFLPGGQLVPLSAIARIEPSLGPARIEHLDRERVVVVGANTEGRSLGEVMGDLGEKLQAVSLPPGVTLSPGGEVEDQAEVFGSIFAALGLAALLMYLVLVVQFGSFLDPVAIMLSLPLSLIGVVLALVITGDTLNIMSLIGVILLMGIIAKNAILLIDFAKWAREERGIGIRAALIEAGRIRLRPIVMTTVAIVAGMVPVALGLGEGGDFRAPLGRAVIGGVITSTLLTLLVIPTVYEILDGWRERLRDRLRRRRARKSPIRPASA
jgi:HAE1 family hydrophobic/amphiphilic exporter-1